MNGVGTTTPTPTGNAGLLEGAFGYLERILRDVTVVDLWRPTPCSDWDLDALLAHLDDSLIALTEAAGVGRVTMRRREPYLMPVGDVVARIRVRTAEAALAWLRPGSLVDSALVGACPLTMRAIEATGAVEVAVHGWDVSVACGAATPIPEPLAGGLLASLSCLVTREDRPVRFASALPISPWMPASARLLALLGRRPAPASDVQPALCG